MVKSRAEICRDYRKRLKEKDNEGYLRKEKERRRRNYIPSALLTDKERAKRNLNNLITLKKHRLKKKQETENEQSRKDISDTSGYESVEASTSNIDNLVVQLPFPNRRLGSKTRNKKALSLANKRIQSLKEKIDELQRKLQSEQRRRQRLLKRLDTSNNPNTPKSKAEKLMKAASLTESQKKVIRKELVFSNVLSEQVKEIAKNIEDKKAKNTAHRFLSGAVVKQYRVAKQLCSRTGLNQNTMSRYLRASGQDLKRSSESFKRKYENTIRSFFERDDNSRCQPGKADVKKVGKELKQTRVLTDYLGNLHTKYISENPEAEVSLATFCRIRPKNIQLCSYISRNSCLCTKHQNMALMIRALRKEGIIVPANPETFANENIDIAKVTEKLPTVVTFSQWKRVEIAEKEKKKSVMRIVPQSRKIEDFVKHLDEQKDDFEKHISRVKKSSTEAEITSWSCPLAYGFYRKLLL